MDSQPIKRKQIKPRSNMSQINNIEDQLNESDNLKLTDNQSPLRYPGGKTRACKILDNIIRQYFDINKFDTMLSPFCGGMSFELYFQNNYNKKIIANDKFTPLYNFWNQVKQNKDELCVELYKINSVSKVDFQNYRTTVLESNGVIQALQYFTESIKKINR